MKKSQDKLWGKFEFSECGKTKKVLKSYCCNAMNYTFLFWITKYKLVKSYRCQRPRYSMTLQSFAMLTFWQKQWFLDDSTHSERFKRVSPKNQAINYTVYRCQVSIPWNYKACKLSHVYAWTVTYVPLRTFFIVNLNIASVNWNELF